MKPNSSNQQEIMPPDSLQLSLLQLFREPIVTAESLKIYQDSVTVGQYGAFEPSDNDLRIYKEYVNSLPTPVQS